MSYQQIVVLEVIQDQMDVSAAIYLNTLMVNHVQLKIQQFLKVNIENYQMEVQITVPISEQFKFVMYAPDLNSQIVNNVLTVTI